MIKKSLIIIIIFLTIMLLVTLCALNNHDLSLQKVATCNLKVKGPVYLITYADGEVNEANEKVLAESALGNCIDVVYMYKREHLDPEFIQKNKNILEAKRGAGYWLWKPYITLRTLEEMPENAVMVYFDAGIKILHPLDKFINNIENYDMVLLDNVPHINKQYTKRYLFKSMDMDNEKVHESGHLNGGMFIIKNTPRTRGFVKKWLEIAQNEKAINDDKSDDEYPEFKDHRHDQSILSLLYLKTPQNIKIVPADDLLDYVYWHRRGDRNMSLQMLDHTAKDWPSFQEYISRMPLLENGLYRLLQLERKMDKWL